MLILVALLCAPFSPSSIAAQRVEIVSNSSYPEFRINNKAFFIHGANFLYPRIPRDLWEDSLAKYKALGINTIDLYVPWNWHEPKQGELDFDGRSNPRRDLIGLLKLLQRLHLRAIIRPGPYICAEWRNGGYPDWLLRKPEYKMSRRALLEGRYPPLSALQYADPEAAAKGWLENAKHLEATRHWYETVAKQIIQPFSAENGGPVILIQLDDDQPAGSRRDGPYFWKYMAWLRDEMRRNGVTLPLSLNPAELENPTLGDRELGKDHPWLMSQWYQRFLGPDLSTASLSDLESAVQPLKMSPDYPPAVVEFNAGFFGMEDDPYGMSTEPINTLSASRILIQNGAKLINYFPLQDSLYPAGQEIPSANRYYAWESPFDIASTKGPKASSVERNGDLVRTFGPLLAASHTWADVGLIRPEYTTAQIQASTRSISAVNEDLAQFGQALDSSKITTDWVDPEAQSIDQLLRYPILIRRPIIPALSMAAEQKLRDYKAKGGNIVSTVPVASVRGMGTTGWGNRRVIANPGLYVSELVSNEGSLPLGRRDASKRNFGFIFLSNLSSENKTGDVLATDPYDSSKIIDPGPLNVPARDSIVLPLRVPLNRLSDHSILLPFAESDELYSSNVELARTEAGEGHLQLGFRAPAGGTVRLRLAHAPEKILLNGDPVSLQREEKDLLWRLYLPPETKSPMQSIDIIFSDPHSADTAPAPPLQWKFPTRIDYRVRPDVLIASKPALLLADRTLAFVLENPSSKLRAAKVLWHHQNYPVSLFPLSSQELRLPINESPGIHEAIISIETDGARTEIPIQYLQVPAGKTEVYPYDFDRDGSQELVLENSKLRVVVDPASGGRILQLVDKSRDFNVASPAGLLRDKFALAEPLDTTWDGEKLPSWTRSREPGLDTRHYSMENISGDSATFSYRADDISYQGASIHKTVSLSPSSSEVNVHYEIVVSSGDPRQAFRIHDVPFVEPGSTLSYEQDGRTIQQAFGKDFDIRAQTRWVAIENGESRWKVSWSIPAWVEMSGREKYAVVEAGFGPMPGSPARQSFDVRYFLGRSATEPAGAPDGATNR